MGPHDENSINVATMDNREASVEDEPLLAGFAILRAFQLLNLDVYYLGLISKSSSDDLARLNRLGDVEAAPKLQQITESSLARLKNPQPSSVLETSSPSVKRVYYSTFLDDLTALNPLQKYIDRFRLLNALCNLLKICVSLAAIMFGFNKLFSNTMLCILNRIEPKGGRTTNDTVSLFVLFLVNLSSLYILCSTIFNGHLLWNLFSQRMFLVSRRFQCRAMLFLLVFVYLEYVINISFTNNLYEWDFTSNNIESGSYSVFANLRIFLTEQDKEHYLIDTLLTIIQFARGVIRISPYVINLYTIICIEEHIINIRNQELLVESLKKRQKLRLAVTRGKAANGVAQRADLNRKKKVIFVTSIDQEKSNKTATSISVNIGSSTKDILQGESIDSRDSLQVLKERRLSYGNMLPALKPITENNVDGRALPWLHSNGNVGAPSSGNLRLGAIQQHNSEVDTAEEHGKTKYSFRISDFDQLESYITNLYIFTGRFNWTMSKQGLTMFFIVHNLVISVSLIHPDAVRGGSLLLYLIRFLLIAIGIVPFMYGQSLRAQLEQLSRQIDRIIIQQQFTHRRRDNLIRIRELIHDIRINCGGLLNFNVESGIKYLVVAFASAFFIKQERKLYIYLFLWLALNILRNSPTC